MANKYELSPEQSEKALQWLNEKANGGGQCPLCNSTEWSVSNALGAITVFSDSFFIPDQGIPVLVLVCQTCGYVRLLHAGAAGLVAEDKSSEVRDG